MKKLMFLFVMVSSAMFFSCSNSEKKVEETKTIVAAKAAYACPMHPEITSDNPGTCSECGMDLEATDKTTASDSTSL